MRFKVNEDYIYLSSECEAEELQIKDAQSQLVRFKIAHKYWGGDSLYIYPKNMVQFEDEKKYEDLKS